MPEQPIIVFDVNETLRNLESIRPTFDRIFHDPAAMRLWFANLITYPEALTLGGVYVPFTDIGGAVLPLLATIPPHPEVPGALRRLRDHGSDCSRSPTRRWPSTGGSWSTAPDRPVRAPVQRR